MGLMCANKGQMGHLASGTGVTESIFALQSMLTGRVPALVNFDIGWSWGKKLDTSIAEPSTNGLNYPIVDMKKNDIDLIVKNGCVFGGNNFSAVFKRIKWDLNNQEKEIEEMERLTQ